MPSSILAGVSEVKVAYLNETNEDDNLDLEMWICKDQPRSVLCNMKKDGKNVCQVTLTFNEVVQYSTSLSSVSSVFLTQKESQK